MRPSMFASVLSIMAVVMLSGIAVADRRIPINTAMVMSCARPASIAPAFNDKFWEANDCSEWAYIDLGAKYHLTELRWSGRTGTYCDVRMRKVPFLVSDDGKNWTTIYTVPSDYVQVLYVTNFVDLVAQNVTTRYVGWKNVDTGSISEAQWWTDSNLLKFSQVSVTDNDPTGAYFTCTITKDGDVPAGDISVTAYKALQDYGENLDDWKAAADVVTEDLGVYQSGVENKVHVNALSGPTYVRFFASCGTVTNFMLDATLFENDPNPITYAEWRPLGKNGTECALPQYTAQWNKDWVFRLFDNDDATAANADMNVTDYGRPIRVDKVKFVSSGSHGYEIQGSNDGWYWTTITNRVSTDPFVVELKQPKPQVYRYFRCYYEPEPAVPKISEIRFYTATNAPYVAINNEAEGLRTRNGCYLGGMVFAGGTNAIANVTLRAWIADRDYGPDEEKWLAAGVKPVTNGVFATGSTYQVGPPAGAEGKINYVRLQVVSDVVGCANGFGEPHPFTMADEVCVPLTQEDVITLMTNYTGYAAGGNRQFTASDASNVYKYQFFGNGTLQSLGDYHPWASSFPQRFRVTRIEWIPRYNAQCNKRCGGAKFYLSDERTLPAQSAASWTHVGSGNTTAGWCERWNQIYVGGMKAAHFKQQGDGHGNEQVRIWGEVIYPGLKVMFR